MSETTGAKIIVNGKPLPASDGFGATIKFNDQNPETGVRAAIRQCDDLSRRVAKSTPAPKPAK